MGLPHPVNKPWSAPFDWGRGLRPPPMPTNSATRAAEWREGCVNRGNWGEHEANRSFGCMGEKGSRPGDGGHWQGTMEVQV